MTSLDPEEINRVKDQPVKCTNCKLTVMVRPQDAVIQSPKRPAECLITYFNPHSILRESATKYSSCL